MFRFYATNYSDEEIIKLEEVWNEMIKDFSSNRVKCDNNCDACHYKNICSDLVKTYGYFRNIMIQRKLIDIKTSKK